MRTDEMTDAERVAHGRVWDCLQRVAQEARAAVMGGAVLPRGSRLREALASLDDAFRRA